MKNLEIILIDDNLPEEDPLIFELKEKYSIVKLFSHSKEGKEYILDNLSKPLIVILDINFSPNEENGHQVLESIREQDKLIPVIIWSANDGSEDDFTDFINNHAISFVKQTSDTDEIIEKVDEAFRKLKLDVATAIETWLEKQEPLEDKILRTEGKEFTATDLIKEIRLQTKIGQKIEENILKLTIDRLFREKETI